MPRPFAPPWAVLALCALFSACGHAKGPPAPRDAPGLAMRATAANRFVKAYDAAEITAVVRVETKPVPRGERPPANIALVVDTSGSMEGKPIEDARAASLALVDSLGPKDHLAVVVFHAKTEVLLPSTLVGDADLPELRSAIGRMRAQGTTDMAGGLAAGLAEVERSFDPHAVNRVVLLGDGVPNDAAPIEGTLGEALAHHVAITSLGLGRDYDESLMGHVALATGGRFHYVDDSSKVAAFFRDEVGRVHDAYARDARLVLTPGPGVTIESVVGQDTMAHGGGVELSLGDMSFGDRRDVVVKLRATGHRDGSAVEVLDAALRFTEGESGEAMERSAFVGVRATADEDAIAKGRDEEVEREAARMEEAARTVEQIRRERQARGEAPAAPVPAPRASPAAPADEAPSPAAASPIAPPPSPDVQRTHDEAMRVLQSY